MKSTHFEEDQSDFKVESFNTGKILESYWDDIMKRLQSGMATALILGSLAMP